MEFAMRSCAVWMIGLTAAFVLADWQAHAQAPQSGDLTLNMRKRIEVAPETGRYHTLTTPTTWNAKKTAIVICDMWDKHWCPQATERVAEMAPRMNEVVKAAR